MTELRTHVRVLAEELHFPEGPAFDLHGALWCVELKGGGFVRLLSHAHETTTERTNTGGEPNGIAIDALGRVWFCDAGQHAIRRYDPHDRSIRTIVDSIDGKPLFRPNDLAFDPAGNLLFTCPGDSRREPTGYVCCIRPGGKIHKIATGFYFPNGLAFSADGAELIIAETYRQRLWRGQWNRVSCEWENSRVWAEGLLGAPGPDGMALGTDGLLYVAVYGSGQIKLVDATGHIVGQIDLPGKNPTNCAFDPTGHLGLIVTEAETGVVLSIGVGQVRGADLFDDGGGDWA